MNFLMGIGTWFGQNILTKPEFFVGLLVFVGYLFLGKKYTRQLEDLLRQL